MASKSLGTLTLDIIAKIGGFTAGLDSAEREAQKRAKAIEKAFDGAALGIGVAFGAISVAAVGAFAAIDRGIEGAAKFQDLAEEIGSTGEEIASFAVAAATAGVSIESVAAASIKLTKSLVGVDDESKAAGAALAAVGIEIEEFKRLDPAAQYEAVGKALSNYADGAGKTAVATALFGKAGAEQLKVFKALEEQGGRMVILTQEQIDAADRFKDAQAKLRAEIGLYASAIATQFIEPTEALIKVLAKAAQETGLLGGEALKLGQNNGVATFAENAISKLAFIIDAVQGVQVVFSRLGEFIGATVAATEQAVKLNFEGVREIRKAYNESLDTSQFKSVREAYKTALADQKEFKRQSAIENRGFNPQQQINFAGAVKKSGGGKKGGGATDDPTKKLLENDLAAFKAMGDQAKELLADRNKMLDLYNQQGLLSVKDYYAGLKTAQEDAVASQAKAFDDQIAALERFKAAAKKDTDVADAQGKINKLTEERAKLYRQAGIEAIAMGVKEQEAAKAVKAAFDEVNAKVLEFQGNLRAAAEIRFDASNEKLRAQAIAENNTQIVAQIDLLKQYTLAQADINKAQQAFSLAQGDLQIAEERITIARERGTMGEIESLKASGRARQEAVVVMERQLAVLLAINDASRSPEQVQQIERLKVQLEGLKATIDPLADKFNNIIADSAGSNLEAFINKTKTAKEALLGFFDDINKQILGMVTKDLAKSFFNSIGGDAGGIGGMLSSLFGGKDAGAGSAAAGTSALASSATTASGAIAALASAASAAALSLGGSGAAGLFGASASAFAGANAVGDAGGDALGELLKLAGYQGGGFTGMGAANDPAGIVHKGEFVLDQAATRRLGVANLNRINSGGSAGFNQTLNIYPQGTINRETTNQIANQTRRVTQKAARLS